MDSEDIKQLVVLQWNSQSIIPKLSQLKDFVSISDPEIDIILLNETWLNSSKNFGIPGYNILRQDSSRPRGGVAAAINSKYKFSILSTDSTYDFQNILFSVSLGSFNLDILSVYIPPPPNGKFNIQHLNCAFSRISSRNYIIVGDFNAHHTAWGCRDVDRRGHLIYKFADNHNLVCLNDHDPKVTTFPPFGQQGNVLDLAFASQSISSSCTLSVLDDVMSSNHFPILIGIFYKNSISSPIRSSYTSTTNTSPIHCLSNLDYKKVDWPKFIKLCEEIFQNFNINLNPLIAYNEFMQTLCDILMTFSRKTSSISSCHARKRKALIWWNDICTQAVEQAKLALHSYKVYPSLENYLVYKQLDAKKKRILSEQKRLSWVNLCSSFNRMTSSKTIWDFIRKYKFSKLNVQVKSHFFDDPNNIFLFLNNITSSVTNNNMHCDSLQSLFVSEGSSLASWLSNPFEFHELHAALINKKNTSPGPDFIPYKVIQYLPPITKNILLIIFNQLWKYGIVPSDWKTQYVVPILKPYKDANSVDAYRPISLTSCFAKCFETMLKNRLEWFIESNLLIPGYQFGFRKGKSSIYNLACLLGDIKNNFTNNKCTIAVFLDIKGAFDNIDHEYLIKGLHQLGLPGPVLKWLFTFLSGRSLYVKFKNNLYGPKYSFKGTPQGSVLSPLVFILSLIHFMLQIPNNVKYSLYADDLVIYLGSDNPIQGQDEVNACLRIISCLLKDQMKLEVNTSKSSVMFFSRIHNFKPNIYYDDILLPLQNKERYLGLILDSELKWSAHIDHIVKKTEIGLNILRSVAGLSWGSDPKILKILYIATIRSHFDYACMFYSDADYRLLRKLDVIQNKALRIISGAMMSSPINSLELEVGVVPLFIRRSYIIDRFCLQLVSRDNLVVNTYLSDYTRPNYNEANLPISSTMSSSIGYLNFEYQDVVFWSHTLPCFNHKFHSLLFDVAVTLTRYKTKFDFLEFLDTKRDFEKVYSDGSKTNDRTSFAFYDAEMQFGRVYECDKLFSIFSAEVLALIYALLYIKDNRFNKYNNKFLILSDSMSALQALSNKKVSATVNYLIYVLRSIIYDLSLNGMIVEFCWVPGHSGILGNEIVDSLAKLTENVEICNFKVPFTDLHTKLKELMLKRWSISLHSTREVKGKWLSEIQPFPSTSAWFEKGSHYLGREFITTLSRLRIGHCLFPAHLHRLKLINNSCCNFCTHEPCTLDHLFLNCPHFNLQRLLFICHCKEVLKSKELPLTVQELLKHISLYNIIFNFVKNSFGRL